jgi:hypothetical protein
MRFDELLQGMYYGNTRAILYGIFRPVARFCPARIRESSIVHES